MDRIFRGGDLEVIFSSVVLEKCSIRNEKEHEIDAF